MINSLSGGHVKKRRLFSAKPRQSLNSNKKNLSLYGTLKPPAPSERLQMSNDDFPDLATVPQSNLGSTLQAKMSRNDEHYKTLSVKNGKSQMKTMKGKEMNKLKGMISNLEKDIES